MVQALHEDKQRLQENIEALQKNRKRRSPSIRSPSTVGENEVPPLHQKDEEISSLSTTPKLQLVEEAISTFSSPSKEFHYVPSSHKTISKMESSSDPKIGAFKNHTKGMGMTLMNNMRYQQIQGLGKHGQGRLQPISV